MKSFLVLLCVLAASSFASSSNSPIVCRDGSGVKIPMEFQSRTRHGSRFIGALEGQYTVKALVAGRSLSQPDAIRTLKKVSVENVNSEKVSVNVFADELTLTVGENEIFCKTVPEIFKTE